MSTKAIEQCFITGFIIFLPLIITYEVVGFILHFVTTPFEWILERSALELPSWVISFIALISVFCIVLFVGAAAHFAIGSALVRLADSIIRKIPVVNVVYNSFKRIIDTTFSTKTETSFRQAALVPFPSREQTSIGFITNRFSTEEKKEFILVLIPCCPNPMTGVLAAFPTEQVTFLECSPDEALKVVMSCGSLSY
jgi:uncharacterized membrane protein